MPRTIRRFWEGQAGGLGEWARSFAYEAFAPDQIADLDPTFSGAVVEAITAADRAIAELEGATGFTGLEALSRQLLRAESVASSRIEGLQLSHRRLSRAVFDPASADRTARSVVANITAMERAIELGSRPGDLTPDPRAHRLLLEGTVDAAIAGRLRDRRTGSVGRRPTGAGPVHPPPGGG